MRSPRATADEALDALRATGTTHVEIVPNWYMDAPNSSSVAPDPAKTPTDASVEHAIAAARELGFDVWLKPHVDVKDGSFRGEIQPDDRAAWFASYSGMIEGYADLAARAGATGFVDRHRADHDGRGDRPLPRADRRRPRPLRRDAHLRRQQNRRGRGGRLLGRPRPDRDRRVHAARDREPGRPLGGRAGRGLAALHRPDRGAPRAHRQGRPLHRARLREPGRRRGSRSRPAR